MSEPTTPPDELASDPPEATDWPVYDVTGVPDDRHARPDLSQLAGALLPRRPAAGARGALVVDRPAELVHLLDADDDAGTFRYRDTRPLAGNPAATRPAGPHVDDLVRAAWESEYDVIAAPWAGAGDEGGA